MWRSRRWLGALAAIVVGILVVVVATQSPSPDDELVRARAWVDDDGRWVTALDAGETMAIITRSLLARIEAEGCDRPELSPRCRGLLTTAAWTEVSAVAVLRCTRPGVFGLRADARHALDALVDGGRGTAQPPPLPVCG